VGHTVAQRCVDRVETLPSAAHVEQRRCVWVPAITAAFGTALRGGTGGAGGGRMASAHAGVGPISATFGFAEWSKSHVANIAKRFSDPAPSAGSARLVCNYGRSFRQSPLMLLLATWLAGAAAMNEATRHARHAGPNTRSCASKRRRRRMKGNWSARAVAAHYVRAKAVLPSNTFGSAGRNVTLCGHVNGVTGNCHLAYCPNWDRRQSTKHDR
jgi:hypothetical protein